MKTKVILITDGDEYALQTIQLIAKEFGGRCISQSKGNPTKFTGYEIVKLIKKAKSEPVFVLFDDSGCLGEGPGERALEYVIKHEDIQILGVLAVASRTHNQEWTKVDYTVDRYCKVSKLGVDKEGIQELEYGRISGDTVYILDSLDVPIIVGIGDIGKMGGYDDVKKGSPVTKKAIKLILERSGDFEKK
ncbi:MAG: stage sporulation protein [Bacillales bacterium]|jgi:stage V sporulation protein AE|nr:stage sporulation protein [Bacillales bacterium]